MAVIWVVKDCLVSIAILKYETSKLEMRQGLQFLQIGFGI